MNSDLITITATLTLYSTEIGGRKTPIKSGYRPNHIFEYKENSEDFVASYIGDINFKEQDLLFPGELATVIVRFLNHGDIEKFIQIGRTWWIHEGKNKIGEAKIIEI